MKWMLRLLHRRCFGYARDSHTRRRAVAAVLLFFLSFQASRFYLAMQLDFEECLHSELTHSHTLSDDHHHHPAQPEAGSHGQSSGPVFDHCKDPFAGMGLTPLPVLAPLVLLSFLPAEITALGFSLEDTSRPQEYWSTLFHPPRQLR